MCLTFTVSGTAVFNLERTSFPESVGSESAELTWGSLQLIHYSEVGSMAKGSKKVFGKSKYTTILPVNPIF